MNLTTLNGGRGPRGFCFGHGAPSQPAQVKLPAQITTPPQRGRGSEQR